MTTLDSLIAAAGGKGDSVRAELFGALYNELHQMARRQLARGGASGRLGVTTLLHEAYLNMARREGTDYLDRAHFMGYAARVMRGIIVDHARTRRAAKRGGQFEITSLDTTIANSVASATELVAIDEALRELECIEPRLAEIVDLKFFCGFTFAEIGEMYGVDERTVRRKWEKARLFLHRSLRAR